MCRQPLWFLLPYWPAKWTNWTFCVLVPSSNDCLTPSPSEVPSSNSLIPTSGNWFTSGSLSNGCLTQPANVAPPLAVGPQVTSSQPMISKYLIPEVLIAIKCACTTEVPIVLEKLFMLNKIDLIYWQYSLCGPKDGGCSPISDLSTSVHSRVPTSSLGLCKFEGWVSWHSHTDFVLTSWNFLLEIGNQITQGTKVR